MWDNSFFKISYVSTKFFSDILQEFSEKAEDELHNKYIKLNNTEKNTWKYKL